MSENVLHRLIDAAAGVRNIGAHEAGDLHEEITPGYTAVAPSAADDAELTRLLAAFTSLSNLQDDPIDDKIAGPLTPAYARFRQRQQYGSLWTFGLRGTF